MRVFTGLPIPNQAIRRLEPLTVQLKSRYPDLRVAQPQGLHITMVFFGELTNDEVLAVMRSMDNPRLKVGSICAVLSGVGQFPPQGRPRVIYCPLVQGAAEVGHLYRTFLEILKRSDRFALEEDREFTAHITLARNKGARLNLSDLEEMFAFDDAVILDQLVLYQSILRPQGAEYKALKTVML